MECLHLSSQVHHCWSRCVQYNTVSWWHSIGFSITTSHRTTHLPPQQVFLSCRIAMVHTIGVSLPTTVLIWTIITQRTMTVLRPGYQWSLFQPQKNSQIRMHPHHVNPTVMRWIVNGSWTRMGGTYFGCHQMRDLERFGALSAKRRFSFKLKVEKYILSIFFSLKPWSCCIVYDLHKLYTYYVEFCFIDRYRMVFSMSYPPTPNSGRRGKEDQNMSGRQ